MSILKEASLEKIRSFRKALFKVAIWVFVGGVIMGALFVLFGGTESAEAFGRVMGTLFAVAVLLAVASNCFRLLEEEASAVQVFAMIGLGFSIFAALLVILEVWGLFVTEETVTTTCFSSVKCNSYHITIMGKILSVVADIAALGVLGANIMAINEYDKGSVLRPLKITATVCLCIEFIYVIIITCVDELVFNETNARLAALAGFAGLIWILAWFVAWIISRNARKQLTKNDRASEHELLEKVQKQLDDLAKANAGANAKAADTADSADSAGAEMSEEEKKMREEIEKRVRAELIEKEIREKVEAEMKAKKAAEK